MCSVAVVDKFSMSDEYVAVLSKNHHYSNIFSKFAVIDFYSTPGAICIHNTIWYISSIAKICNTIRIVDKGGVNDCYITVKFIIYITPPSPTSFPSNQLCVILMLLILNKIPITLCVHVVEVVAS